VVLEEKPLQKAKNKGLLTNPSFYPWLGVIIFFVSSYFPSLLLLKPLPVLVGLMPHLFLGVDPQRHNCCLWQV